MFYLLSLQLMLCCVAGLKAATASIMQSIFYFLSFEISRNSLRNHKFFICLDLCIKNKSYYLDPIWINISLFIGCLVETRNNRPFF